MIVRHWFGPSMSGGTVIIVLNYVNVPHSNVQEVGRMWRSWFVCYVKVSMVGTHVWCVTMVHHWFTPSMSSGTVIIVLNYVNVPHSNVQEVGRMWRSWFM